MAGTGPAIKDIPENQDAPNPQNKKHCALFKARETRVAKLPNWPTHLANK
jgi:hypothetical protein